MSGPSTDARIAAIIRRGVLRLALFPSFFYRREQGEPRGVGIILAGALAKRLGVTLACTEYASPPKVVEALRHAAADVALLGIDKARATDVDFSPPLLSAEFTFLAPAGSTIGSVAEVDRLGRRIALVRHHAMDTALRTNHAERIYAETPDAAFDLFRAGGADVLAGIRPGLIMYASRLSGSRVLDDGYGRNTIALAVKKNEPGWLTAVGDFVVHARHDGAVQRAVDQAGLKGVQAE